MKYLHSLLLLILFILFLPVFATEKERDRLAVMDVQDEDKILNEKSIAKVTDYIFSQFEKTRSYFMIQKSDRDTALEQALEETVQGSRKGCVDEKCQLSMTAQLQANFLINTKIKKLYKGTCQITISLIDAEKRASLGNWEEKFNCTEKGLYDTIDSFYFGASKNEGAVFQTGKIGKLEDEWTPEMAGRGEVGVIHFESDPEGANIYFDKELLGRTPKFKSKSLPTGRHQIKVEKEGYYTEVITKDLKKGDRVSVKLFPGIKITSSPEGAVVRLNGRLLCDSTPCEKVIDEGNVELTFEKDMYKPMKQSFNIKRGNDINIKLDPNFGWLEVKSDYEGIEITLDDNVIGNTPIEKRMESIGPHIIGAKHKCYHTTGENIEIELMKTTTVKVDVKPKTAAIDVSAKDSDGNDLEENIFVDGQMVGKTPNIFTVNVCSREVEVAYKGGTQRYDLVLKEKQTEKIEFVFEEEKKEEKTYSYNYDNDAYNKRIDQLQETWSKKSPSKLNWYDAVEYCNDLVEDYYSDWRLPTISELKTLIKNCYYTDAETKDSCEVNNECSSSSNCWGQKCEGCSGSSSGKYSKLGDSEWLWSSSELSDGAKYAWGVDFYAGAVLNNKKDFNRFFFRCIRGGTLPIADANKKVTKTKHKSYSAPKYKRKSEFFLITGVGGFGHTFTKQESFLEPSYSDFVIESGPHVNLPFGYKYGPFSGVADISFGFNQENEIWVHGSMLFRYYFWEAAQYNFGSFVSIGPTYIVLGSFPIGFHLDFGMQITRILEIKAFFATNFLFNDLTFGGSIGLNWLMVLMNDRTKR